MNVLIYWNKWFKIFTKSNTNCYCKCIVHTFTPLILCLLVLTTALVLNWEFLSRQIIDILIMAPFSHFIKMNVEKKLIQTATTTKWYQNAIGIGQVIQSSNTSMIKSKHILHTTELNCYDSFYDLQEMLHGDKSTKQEKGKTELSSWLRESY